MQAYDEKEKAWEQQLKESTQAIATLAQEGITTVTDSDDEMDAEAEEAAVATAARFSKTVDQAYPTCPASVHGHILEDPRQSKTHSNHIAKKKGNACSEDPSTLQGCNISPKKADFSEQEAETTLVARALSLDSLIPRGPSFGTCATPSMLQDLTAGHGISQLCRGVPGMKHFHNTAHEAFATWLLTDIVEWSEVAGLHVFTDGAFVEETPIGAWACVVAIESAQGTWQWQGALADQCNEDGTQDSGTCKNAFAPEAMRGLIIALTCPFPVRMHYDCESAAACVLGSASSDHPIIHAAAHVLEILKSQQRSVYFWHGKSHSGVALNEMADCWAKLAAKGIGCAPHGDLVPSFAQDGLLNWLRLSMRETQTECQWPYIDDLTGAFTYTKDAKKRISQASVLCFTKQISMRVLRSTAKSDLPCVYLRTMQLPC